MAANQGDLMTRTRGSDRTFLVVFGLSTLVLAMPAQASDGVIEINQASAIAGGIVPLDAPGVPVRLEAGSYRLTGNFESAGTVLDVQSDNVRIDLNGFTVRCTGCGASTHGVDANLRHHVHVSNGLIEDFGDAGIVLGAFGRVDRVGLRDNGGHWVDGALVVGNTVISNGGDGIEIFAAAKIDANMIFFNTGAGLRFPVAFGDSTYEGNTFGGNAMPGIVGAVTNGGNNYCNQGSGVC